MKYFYAAAHFCLSMAQTNAFAFLPTCQFGVDRLNRHNDLATRGFQNSRLSHGDKTILRESRRDDSDCAVSVGEIMKESKKTGSKEAVSKHKTGILSPAVFLEKEVLGEEELNKLRAKFISKHSDVIKAFVGTAEETEFGKNTLKLLFELSDKNKNGRIEVEELEVALRSLGFEWLQEKQIRGILQRADANDDGVIEMDEWLQEAPKTLRTNLVKLAKKNGGD